MFKNLLKTSIRSITRNKLFSLINIIGLAISMSLCLLVITLITEIKSYDKFNAHSDAIYRVITHRTVLDNATGDFASTTLAMLPNLKQEFSEIETVVGMRDGFSGDMDTGSRILPLSGIYIDNAFFDVFSFPLASGNPETALAEPFSIVLTQEASIKLFGDEDPIGKVLTIHEGDTYQVTGLFEKLPRNSHLKFESLVSLSTIESLALRDDVTSKMSNWSDIYQNYVYIKINEGASIENIEERLNTTVEPVFRDNARTKMAFSLQRLDNIMTGPLLSNQLGLSLPPVVLIIISVLTLLIMLTAGFNYTNLSLARGIRRAKEVGIRKVVGAKRRQVLSQFVLESVLISLGALVLGYGLFLFVKQLFLGLAPEMQQLFSLEISTVLILKFVLFALAVGILAGLLPSLILSKIKPITALRDTSGVKLFRHINLRKVLLIVQFTLSLIFINATYIMSKQFKFVQDFDLGFETSNVLNIPLQGNDRQTVFNQLTNVPGVEEVSFSQFIPSTGSAYSSSIKYKNPLDSIDMNDLGVDENYLALHKFDLIVGENFEEREGQNSLQQVIVNEAFVKYYSIESPEAALGEIISVDGKEAIIKAVVRDFYYHRINSPIEPFLLRYTPELLNWANLKIESSDLPTTMAKIEEAWTKVDPMHEIQTQFFNERIQQAYGQFSIFSKVIGFISFLAISIAALGLLGMAVYIIETKMKEVSIRKTLGASEQILMQLLSRSFVRMLIIASLIALPITYMIFDKAIFASSTNHTEIGAMELSFGILLIFIISIITVGSQVYKAATSNPVDHLRNE